MRIKYTAMGSMFGPMEDNMKVSGRTIICMDEASTLGRMEESTKENIWTIESTATESTPGPTVDSMLETGRMENSMEKEFTDLQMEQRRTESGKTAKGLAGSKNE